LDVLNSILLSDKSELYKKLVIDEQKCRFLGGGAQDSRDPYLISISASLISASDMQYVKDAIVAAYEKAKTSPVDPQLLKDTKSHLKYSFAMNIDNPTSIAESLSAYTWLTNDPESLNRLYALYDKVTAEDLMMVAKKYILPNTLTIGTISPNAKEVIR
jgi:zinc protease